MNIHTSNGFHNSVRSLAQCAAHAAVVLGTVVLSSLASLGTVGCSQPPILGTNDTQWAADPITVDSLLYIAQWISGDTVVVQAQVSRAGNTSSVVLNDASSGCKLRVDIQPTAGVEADDIEGHTVVFRGLLCEKRTTKADVKQAQCELLKLKETNQIGQGAFETAYNDLAAKTAFMDLQHTDYYSEYFLRGFQCALVP